MKYYKLIYDYDNDDNFINCSIGCIGDMNEYVTSNGKIIKDWKDVVFKYHSDEGNVMSDYVANVYRWLIVSSNFCFLINKMISSTNIQYLPIKLVETNSGIENETYKVANILDVVDALDLKHSQYDIFELNDEKIISVEKYALKASEIKGHDIFRLKSDTIPIFISERIKKIIEENELSGFAFLEVSVY